MSAHSGKPPPAPTTSSHRTAAAARQTPAAEALLGVALQLARHARAQPVPPHPCLPSSGHPPDRKPSANAAYRRRRPPAPRRSRPPASRAGRRLSSPRPKALLWAALVHRRRWDRCSDASQSQRICCSAAAASLARQQERGLTPARARALPAHPRLSWHVAPASEPHPILQCCRSVALCSMVSLLHHHHHLHRLRLRLLLAPGCQAAHDSGIARPSADPCRPPGCRARGYAAAHRHRPHSSASLQGSARGFAAPAADRPLPAARRRLHLLPDPAPPRYRRTLMTAPLAPHR